MKLLMYNKSIDLSLQYKASARAMWFKHSVLLVGIIFLFECNSSNLSNSIRSTFLEESVILKLRAASHIRDNVLKIFNQLQSTNYELNHSVQRIRKYLRNGGSFIESLHILPTLGYAPVETQFNGILSAMVEHSPRYLLPAINGVRNTIDIKAILQTDEGPLRVDIFKGILARDLSSLALPTPFPKRTESNDCCGRWPSFIKKTFASMSLGTITQSALMVALILKNLIGPDYQRSVDSVKRSRRDLESNDKENIPHSPVEATAESILSYSKIEKSVPELAAFFDGDTMNYSLLLNNKHLPQAQSLLTLIESDESLVKNALADFEIYEYSTPDDLLTAVVGKLRRYQAEKGIISEIIEDAYASLIRKSHHAWREPPRSARAVKSLCYGMKIDPNSPKIRRLAKDVGATIEANVSPETWSTVSSGMPEANCYGPSCTVLETLKGIQELRAIHDPALNMSILNLVKTYSKFYREDVKDSCPNLLADTLLRDLESTNIFERILDVDDLMQAIPGLDVNSKEYINLRDFLSSKDLENQIGEDIDVKEHPTRGRLLVWLLGKVQRSTNIDQEIQSTARKFIDSIAYDGYGAVAVSFRRV